MKPLPFFMSAYFGYPTGWFSIGYCVSLSFEKFFDLVLGQGGARPRAQARRGAEEGDVLRDDPRVEGRPFELLGRLPHPEPGDVRDQDDLDRRLGLRPARRPRPRHHDLRPVVAGQDGHQRVGRGVVEIGPDRHEHIDVDVLGVHRRRGRPLLVGAIDAVGGPEQVRHVLELQLPVGPLPGRGPDRQRFHDRKPPLRVRFEELDRGQLLHLPRSRQGDEGQDPE